MTSQPSLTPETILTEVRQWSAADRLALIQALLQTLHPAPGSDAPRIPTLSRALGLAATDQPPPDDAQVETWLDEHRQEKYG